MYILKHIVTVLGCASVECTLNSRFIVEADYKPSAGEKYQARPSLLGTSHKPLALLLKPSR